MEEVLEQIREKQKASWNKFSPGWKKWDAFTMGFLQGHGEAMTDILKPSGAHKVLDIAGGTGEPSLTIASMLDGGQVTITDLSDGMLDVARGKATERGVSNVDFQTADACELPFEDNSFDLVSCRLGFMFFPDMMMAAKEIVRVLKPGGRFATTVWGQPENNFWVTCMVKNINEQIGWPAPPPGAPGMFRCAPPNLMKELFEQAGLRDVTQREITSTMDCRDAQEYWDMMTDIAAPFVAALGDASEDAVERVHQGVLTDMSARFPDGKIDTCGWVIGGSK